MRLLFDENDVERLAFEGDGKEVGEGAREGGVESFMKRKFC